MTSVVVREADGKRRRRHLDEVTLKGPMAERVGADGRRQLMLTNKEKKAALHQKRVEQAVALFLDIERDHSWADIAQELGVSKLTLNDLTKSDEFIECYNAHFVEVGHDPRLQATQAALVDMLPAAVRELKKMITDPDVSASVRLKAIERVIELNGLKAVAAKHTEQNELQNFLQGLNVQGDVTVNLGAPYEQNIRSYVEGQYENVASHETPANPRLGPGGEDG